MSKKPTIHQVLGQIDMRLAGVNRLLADVITLQAGLDLLLQKPKPAEKPTGESA